MKLSRHLPHLEQFFGAYFHEDWMEEFHDGTHEAVKYFLDGSPDATIRATTEELSWLLCQGLTDEALGHVVTEELRAAFYAPGANTTYTAWLEDIQADLIAHAKPNDTVSAR